MLCVSITESTIRIGQVVQESDLRYSIEKIDKKSLPFQLNAQQLNNPTLPSQLKKVFTQLRNELNVPDTDLALSLPTSCVDFTIQKMDSGLDTEALEQALEWQTQQRLGIAKEKRFVQHYPLQNDKTNDQVSKYLTVSYPKALGKILIDSAKPANFNIKLVDINGISALHTIENVYPVEEYSKWGLWLVQPEEETQVLSIVDSGEFRQYLEFKFLDENNFNLLKQTSPDELGKDVVAEITEIKGFEREAIETLDRLFIYSHHFDSELYNMILSFDIDNLVNVDPFQKMEPLDPYQEDGEGAAAMSQFMDVMGLIVRAIPTDKL